MLDGQLVEGEVPRVPRSKSCSGRDRGSADKAVALAESDPTLSALPAPSARLYPFEPAKPGDVQPLKQALGGFLFVRAQPADQLFDVDRAGQRRLSTTLDRVEPSQHSPTPAQGVDQDRGIQQNRHGSTDTFWIRISLRRDPCSRIFVPLVSL